MAQMEKITCPHCKNESERKPLSSINIDRTPEMRAKVQDLSCFRWRCPVCGATSLVMDPCLYHDLSGQFMVCCGKIRRNGRILIRWLGIRCAGSWISMRFGRKSIF